MNNYKTMNVRQLVSTAQVYARCFDARGMTESAELIDAIAERLAQYAGIEDICNQ